jgi:hypothetical protein
MAEDDRGVGVLEVLVQVSEWMRTAVSAITSTEPDTTTHGNCGCYSESEPIHDTSPAISLIEINPACNHYRRPPHVAINKL